jgi:hypothetical protein
MQKATRAVYKFCLDFVARERMVHVSIEPLLEEFCGNFRMVVLGPLAAFSRSACLLLDTFSFLLSLYRPACIARLGT